MASRMMTLEVTVVSAEEVVLPPTRRPLGRGAYAVVRTAASASSPAAAVCTRVDEESGGDCDGYPYWKEALRVALPEGARWLDVEICRRRPNGQVEAVAAASVPVGDFTVGPPGHLHCLSYRLFDASGCRTRRNGIVNITVRRTDAKYTAPPPPPPPVKAPAYAGASGSGGSCYGVPPAGAAMGFPVGFTANGKACA
uniref:C2 domain-containing protein n=1 Tax=Oryza meridionalis TaxID=40149 RepID=A0A0E0EU16_9ORYZ